MYKQRTKYIYKRRIPNTDHFYTFNTQLTNKKRAAKLIRIFNNEKRRKRPAYSGIS